MENHIKLTPGFNSGYIRQFQVALRNFTLVNQEEKRTRRERVRRRLSVPHDSR